MKHKVKRIHFIGIGGAGMSGIAEVLHNLGYYVSGSDMAQSINTIRLSQVGVVIYIGHAKEHIEDADVVVISTAVEPTNIELSAALDKHIPVIPRAMMLAEIMRFKYGVAIAGTHGKTTTTSLCSEVLASSGLDPTFIIGGKLAVSDSNAKLGAGDYLIAEADESDASFLHLNPLIAVVTNIDLDHMSTYDHDEDKLKQTFIDFLHKLPFYGRAILCNEDARIRSILSLLKCPFTTYGLNDSADIYALNIVPKQGSICFDLCIKDSNDIYPMELNLPGKHNLLNALAAIAVGIECNCKIEHIALGLKDFHGVARRAQRYPDLHIQGKTAYLIDDYGHHPTELAATLDGLRASYPTNRLVLSFQPHRYTRTRDLFNEFVNILATVDNLILIDTYSAGEPVIPEASVIAMIEAIRGINSRINLYFAKDLDAAKLKIFDILCNDDLVVTMGAGNIGQLPKMLLQDAS